MESTVEWLGEVSRAGAAAGYVKRCGRLLIVLEAWSSKHKGVITVSTMEVT